MQTEPLLEKRQLIIVYLAPTLQKLQPAGGSASSQLSPLGNLGSAQSNLGSAPMNTWGTGGRGSGFGGFGGGEGLGLGAAGSLGLSSAGTGVLQRVAILNGLETACVTEVLTAMSSSQVQKGAVVWGLGFRG